MTDNRENKLTMELRRKIAGTFNLTTPEEIDQKWDELCEASPDISVAIAQMKPSLNTERLDIDLETTKPMRGFIPGFVTFDDAAFAKDCTAELPSEEAKALAENLKHFEAPAFLQQPLDMDFASLGKSMTDIQLANWKSQRENGFIDSLSEMEREPLPANEEILTILFVQGGKSTATWHGKTLEERTSGDWANPQRMAVHRTALAMAWKTKFKEKMPLNLHLNISMDGTFSPFGARNNVVVARKIPTGKHSGSKAQQRNKAKRRK